MAIDKCILLPMSPFICYLITKGETKKNFEFVIDPNDPMVHVMHGAADIICSAADMMHFVADMIAEWGVVGWPG